MIDKVCIITNTGDDFLNSRINFLYYLQELGYETFALIPRDTDSQKIKATGIHTYFYSFQKSWKIMLYFITVPFAFFNIFRHENPNIVFTYKLFPNIVGILVSCFFGVGKIVSTIAGLGFLKSWRISPLVFLLFHIYIYILNKSHYVIVQNTSDYETLGRFINKEKLVLTNGSGVDKKRFNETDILPIRKKLNLAMDCIYFLFCARLIKEKGIFELVDAYNELKTEIKTGLIIAGNYENKLTERKLQKKMEINDGIRFLGYYNDINGLINASNCVVLPSYYGEGVPRVLIEALAMSKPVITTNHPGCKETCEDGINGFLVEPKNAEDLKNKMIAFINLKDDKIGEMATSSHALFNRKFEQAIIFKQIASSVLGKDGEMFQL